MDDDCLKKERTTSFPNLHHNDSPNLDPDYSLRVLSQIISSLISEESFFCALRVHQRMDINS